MSYQALARKWRPKTFGEVIGQEHVVAALVNALDNQRVHHAFLFTGTRGVGKTTLARIFAKALNCEQGVGSNPCGECVACRGVDNGNFIDLLEVDAASRTKVDDTRELLDNVQYTPAQGRFKIYLIDEVHMLSTHSFNALLKTLEEPPAHVKFLLATTDPQKLPTTILSRCIQFNLKAMDLAQLNAQLEKILVAEAVEFDAPALAILARSANGSVRDALSLLDQGIAFGNGEVREDKIRAMLGMIDDEFTRRLLRDVCLGSGGDAMETVAEMALRSVDFSAALDEILSALHNLSLYQIAPQAVEDKGVDTTELATLAGEVDGELLQLIYQIALIGKRDLTLAPDPRSGFEMALLRMISFRPDADKNVKANVNVKTGTKVVDGGAKSVTAAPAKSVADAPATKPISVAQLGEPAHWAACIEQSGLSGVARELMMNMAPQSVADDTVHLSLDAGHKHLLSDARVKKIEQHLAAKLSQAIKLAVTIDDGNADADGAGDGDDVADGNGKVDADSNGNSNGNGDTPSRRQQRDRQAQQQAAEKAFQHDPTVQELVDLFEGEIVSDSIRPPPA